MVNASRPNYTPGASRHSGRGRPASLFTRLDQTTRLMTANIAATADVCSHIYIKLQVWWQWQQNTALVSDCDVTADDDMSLCYHLELA